MNLCMGIDNKLLGVLDNKYWINSLIKRYIYTSRIHFNYLSRNQIKSYFNVVNCIADNGVLFILRYNFNYFFFNFIFEY